ncbi:MAG: glycosyltransferase family 9 protein [Chthonomonadetes bacterium]|nr:glycosyltransferase family 9 protein [Chthonomonadetes bacterium]
MRTPRRVLVVRQDRLGDLLLTTPVATVLKKAVPECHITYMIRPHLHEIVEYNPNIDAVWHTAYSPPVSEWLHWIRKIRRERLDAIILGKPDSGAHTWIAALARIPVRVGSTHKYYARFLTHNLPFDFHNPPIHEVELVTTMAQHITSVPLQLERLYLPVLPLHEQQAEKLLQVSGINPVEPFFCVHPGTGGSSHSWYPERYGQVARKLSEATGWKAVVTGGNNEKALAEVVCHQAGEVAVNFAGQTSVPVLGAVLRRAKLLVSGDTGAVHVAASVGTPCVVVHPVSDYRIREKRWHPWMVPYRIVPATAMCPGCTPQKCAMGGESCKRSITADAVVEAALSLAHELGL